jgi:putative FmdB family regulatory protein
MPIYEYECQTCGLQFEKLKSMSKCMDPEPCPECAAPEAKKLMSVVNHTFAHTVVGGPRPQNTGVHAIDYNVDRTIGRDAEQRWGVIEKRNNRKNVVIRDSRKSGLNVTNRDQLVRTTENDYRVITEQERLTVNAGREKHNQVMQKIAKAIKAKKKA